MNCGNSLAETIKLLGCFSASPSTKITKLSERDQEEAVVFREIFDTCLGDLRDCWSKHSGRYPPKILAAIVVFRMLHDLAIEAYEKSSRNVARVNSVGKTSCDEDKPKKPILNLSTTPPAPEPTIVHPGTPMCPLQSCLSLTTMSVSPTAVVTSMLKLLPGLQDENNVTLGLQLAASDVMKSLLRSDRNQQTLCDVSLVADVLEVCVPALEDDEHPLHGNAHCILERLAAQKLEPSDLRNFLRLGNPLACLDPEREGGGCGFVPLTRIKTLVSMTTPRDSQQSNSIIQPPFVELDMTSEGFGCLFIPSLSPSSRVTTVTAASSPAATKPEVTAAGAVVKGGIGSGDRPFPPSPNGLSFSTWVCVDKFSDPRCDPHPIRLLTIVRQLVAAGDEPAVAAGEDDAYVCLSICLSARDKAVIITTQESQ